MKEKAEKQMIEKWLLIVDKPLMIGDDAEAKRNLRFSIAEFRFD